MIQYHLASLVAQGIIQKVGKVPRVFYIPAIKKAPPEGEELNPQDEACSVIEKEFLFISSIGERTYGWKGFQAWCTERGFDPIRKATEYTELWKSYE